MEISGPRLGALFEAEMLTACSSTNRSLAQSPDHETVLITGLSGSEGHTCQQRLHHWKVIHLQRIKPMLGLCTWHTGALWNHCTHLADSACYSVQEASSSLPCDIFFFFYLKKNFFLTFIHFLIESVSRAGAEREGDTVSEAGSRL